MKCTSIKLSTRQDNPPPRAPHKENTTPAFTGENGHSYSFPFSRPTTTRNTSTTLAVTTINLPDNIQCFNTGSSLDKWSKKRTRLKSAKICKTPTEFDTDFCYETLETDLSILLDNPDDLPRTRDGSLDNLQYEVHSDIEKLLEETRRSVEQEDQGGERRRKKRGKGRKKKVKMLRFSKTPSPQTEQVIRVDVTSNVSANEDKRRVVEIRKLEEQCGKEEEVMEDGGKEMKESVKEGVEMCDEEFIVRCRQLALRQRRSRRLR